jgi:outer membrane lipoprotein-sorting protein
MSRMTLPVVLAAAALAAPAAAQTADQVIAKSFEARGGLARLKSIHSVRMTGRMSAGPDDLAMVVELKRPNKVRVETSGRGRTAVQAYDGKTAWGIPPTGTGRPQVVPSQLARDIAEQADIDGPLVDYQAKGNRVELVGREGKVDGRSAFKLKVTRKDGNVAYYFIDTRSYLPIRVEATRTVQGRVIEAEGTMSDYREAGGFLWPYRLENGAKGMPDRQVITIDRIEVNPAIDDARFTMPDATKPADAPRD